MKNWKSTLLGILLLFAQAFIDSQKSKLSADSLIGYAAGAGLVVAADAKKEEK